MPKEKQISRKLIIEASFDYINRCGFHNLSARKIANEIKTSVAPIYDNFTNMESLQKAIEKYSFEKLVKYANEPYTHDPSLNVGTGLVRFAYEYPVFYYRMFADSRYYKKNRDMIEKVAYDNIKKRPLFKFNDDILTIQLMKVMIDSVLAYALSVAGRYVKDKTIDEFYRHIEIVGDIAIKGVLYQNGYVKLLEIENFETLTEQEYKTLAKNRENK